MADGVYVNAGGNWQPLRDEADKTRQSIEQVGQALHETGRQAAGTSGISGSDGGARGLDQYRFSVDSLGRSMLENLGAFGGFMVALNSTLGVVGDVVGVVGQAVDGFLQLAGTIGGVVVDAVRAAADEIGNLVQQVFSLNEQTEKNFFNWGYLYGGPNGGGVAAAGELARWSKQASLSMPFTRQDLMAAITVLSAQDNATPQSIENELKLISDVAATQGRPGLTLAWAAQAALRASQPGGSARMLMMDLNLNKTELAKYGYDESDNTTFFPALEAYEKAKGSYGASGDISRNTLWGAQTSAVDRLQNFGLSVGGWNDNPKTLTDDVKKGSMFWYLKQDLVDITKWWDDHSKDINQIATLFQNVLGGAVKDLTAAFQGLMTGLHASGLDKIIENMFESLGQWLNNPAVSAGLKTLTEAFGQMAGSGISTVLQAAGAFFQGLSSTGVPQALFNGLINLFNNIGAFFNAHKTEINDFFYELGKVSGGAIKDIAQGFKDIGAAFQHMKENMSPSDWANLKWFISDNTIGVIGRIGLAFKALADIVAGLVYQLTQTIHAMQWINDHTGGAAGGWFGNGGGNGNGNSDQGGNTGGSDKGHGTKAHLNSALSATHAALSGAGGSALIGSSGGGGNVSTSSSSTSNLYGGTSHNSVVIHGAAEARIVEIAKRVLMENDLAQNILARRSGGYRPGLFGSLG